MSNLSNQQINNSFDGILQVPGGITSTLQTVQDGNGNPTGLQLSTIGSNIATASSFVASANATSIPNVVSRLISDGFGDYLSLKDFGAVGDGVTDDLLAIKNALESGYIIDGGGLTYAINGTCAPTSMVGLRNANFIQIGNTTATNISTLSIIGISNFFIDNVTINMGTNITTLFSDDGNNGLKVWGVHVGASTTYIENFRISNVTVTGNGCGTGINVRHAKRFIVDGCLVHDRVSGSSPDPTNDSQNGISITNCANFTLANSQIYNLQTRLSGIPNTKWTRGFLFSEIRDCSIVGCNSTSVDQGFDFSGAYSAADGYIGNRRFTLSCSTANSCQTYGFKFANVTRDGVVSGCIANNTGTIGFVFSPSAVAITGFEQYNTQNIDVIGCKVVNVLGNGWSGSGAQGFRIMTNGIYSNYPRAIRFNSCSVIDTQSTPTTLNGFASESGKITYPTTGYNTNIANVTTGCSVGVGVTTPYNDIGPYSCTITGTTTQSINDAIATLLNWDINLTDPTGLHNITSNNSAIYIKAAGWYQIQAQVQFATNATGYRYIRFLKNGSILDRTTATVAGSSVINAYTSSSILEYLLPGDYIEVQAYQNSGGALAVRLNESAFSIALVG